MGFHRIPGDPFGGLGDDLLEASVRLIAGGRPAHPAIEETEFPAIDVFETPAELVIEAELPGVAPGNVAVTAGENLIVVEGLKEEGPGPGRVNFLCMERSFGAFRRVVLTGAAVDLRRASANLRDGLLQVRVPRIDEKRGRVRAIPVTAEPTRSEP